ENHALSHPHAGFPACFFFTDSGDRIPLASRSICFGVLDRLDCLKHGRITIHKFIGEPGFERDRSMTPPANSLETTIWQSRWHFHGKPVSQLARELGHAPGP